MANLISVWLIVTVVVCVIGLVIKTLTGFKGALAVDRANVYEHNNLQGCTDDASGWSRISIFWIGPVGFAWSDK